VSDLRIAGRRILQIAVALAAMAGISALAHLPVGRVPVEGALRLALRTRTARIEICHDRTEEELAALPAHLRQVRVCEERPIDYRLAVRIDDVLLVERLVEHHGVRHNRPLVVDELLSVEPGIRRLEIRFEPPPVGLDDAPDEDLAALPRSTLAQSVAFSTGRIELVVLDENGALRLVAGDG